VSKNHINIKSGLFKSKAQTLNFLENKLTKAVVPKLFIIKCSNLFNETKFEIIKLVYNNFKNKPIIVRSSSEQEDKIENSGAGEFISIKLDFSWNKEQLENAIFKIINCYKDKLGKENVYKQEILIQELVEDVVFSGVIFTRELNFGAPYVVVNYDDITGSTSSVTSGVGEHANKNLFIHRSHIKALRSERFIKLMQVVKELELICKNSELDIEFAVDKQTTVFILQVRPITTKISWPSDLDTRISNELAGIHYI